MCPGEERGQSPHQAPGPGTRGEKEKKPRSLSGHQLPTPHDWNQLTPESASVPLSSSGLSREVRAPPEHPGGRAPPAHPCSLPVTSSLLPGASAGGDTKGKSYLTPPGQGQQLGEREVGSSVQPHGGGGRSAGGSGARVLWAPGGLPASDARSSSSSSQASGPCMSAPRARGIGPTQSCPAFLKCHRALPGRQL